MMEPDMTAKDWIVTVGYLMWMPIIVLTFLGIYINMFLE